MSPHVLLNLLMEFDWLKKKSANDIKSMHIYPAYQYKNKNQSLRWLRNKKIIFLLHTLTVGLTEYNHIVGHRASQIHF